MKPQRRTQKEKSYVQHVQNLRRSNATAPIPSGKRYKRPAPGLDFTRERG